MNASKRFFAWLANLGLGVMLFFFASTVILVFTLFNTGYIKNTLAASGFYKNFVPSTLNLVSSESLSNPNSANEQQLLNDLEPTIQKIATPQVVQEYSEQIIDGAGVWLKSTNQNFYINLNIKPLKNRLSNGVSDYVLNRINNLPACTNYSLNIDVLNATCKPPIEISRQTIEQEVNDYMASLPFLQTDTLTLGKQNDQSIKNSPLAAIPTVYKLTSWSPFVFGFLGLVCVGLIYVLNDDKYRAWRLIGHAFLITGALLVVSGAISIIFVSHGIKQAEPNASTEQLAFTNQIIVPIAKKIISSIGYWSLYFGVGYALAGAACYFISHRLKLKANATPKPTQI